MGLIATFSLPTRKSEKIKLDKNTLRIGREAGSGLILDHPSVSRKHALITLIDNKNHIFIEDHYSSNSTFVDGIKLERKTRLHPDQQVKIGPYKFTICYLPECHNAAEQIPEPHSISNEVEEQIIKEALDSLPEMLDPNDNNEQVDNKTLVSRAEKLLYPKILNLLPPQADTSRADVLLKKALTQAMGLGPLEDWLKDPSVTEIMINGKDRIYVEIDGRLYQREPVFKTDKDIYRVIERILAPIGRRVDETTPYVDGRLPDGSRINVAIPPISLSGPILTIRKFSHNRLEISVLIKSGSISEEASNYLEGAVVCKKNVLISGGTGSGKTTFLNAIATFIPNSERIITIEDAAELNLSQDHIVSLETRPPNVEGSGEITTRDLVRNSLRMRPDRIIVGECRGGEAMDMLQAMNTGHEGSITTCHANSPRDALKRIETMAMMSGLEIPHSVIREQVASAIHIVVQLMRAPNGKRVVESIVEVDRLETDQILTQEIFKFTHEKGDEKLTATGLKPSFELPFPSHEFGQRNQL